MAQRKKQGRKHGGEKRAGPKYPPRLLKEIGEPLELNDRSKRRHLRKSVKNRADEAESVANDVYEYEEGVPQEESGKNRRFDDVDNLEYELPPDFEDEEIDEGVASGEENFNNDLGKEEEEEEYGEEEEDEQEEYDEEVHEKMLEEITGRTHKRDKGSSKENEENHYIEAEQPDITVDDLLAQLQDKPGINALKKRMRQLEKEAAPVRAPLPRVIQEKLDRQAGYEKTNEEISKWQPIVKKNRETPSLNFDKKLDVSLKTTASMAAEFKPSTSFEKEIAEVLKENGVADPYQVEDAEILELNKLSVEEVKERQERLAKMRSLLFRHEERSKRMKKIKSKTFRRIARRSLKAKADMLLDDPELQKEEAMKQELERAKERASLKHKNTKNWAKRILKRGLIQHNEGIREAINEQLRDHALLTRKIHSANINTSDEEEASDSEDEDEPQGLVLDKKPSSKVLAKAKVATLKSLEEGNETELPTSGIFSLPFMARAIERKRKEAENEAKAVLEEIEKAEDGGSEDIPQNFQSGRQSFGSFANQSIPKPSVEDVDLVERGSDSEYSEDEGANIRSAPRPVPVEGSQLNEITLDGMVHTSVEHTTRIEGPVSVDSTQKIAAVDEQNPEGNGVHQTNKKKNKKKNKNKRSTQDTNGVQNSVISANPTIFGAGKSEQSTKEVAELKGVVSIVGRSNKAERDADTDAEMEDEHNSENEDDEEFDGEDDVIIPADQKEIVRMAFAGDDVQQDFDDRKAELANQEGPKEESERLDLPGWGQWTDVQKKHGPPKWLIKQQEELKKKQEAAKKRRLDANLTNVIVSEKTDKKASKFLSNALPFPYTSKEVFEKTMRMPIGRDFNTNQAFEELTRPAEIKSAGVIIEPINYEKPQKSSNKKRKQTELHSDKRRRIKT